MTQMFVEFKSTKLYSLLFIVYNEELVMHKKPSLTNTHQQLWSYSLSVSVAWLTIIYIWFHAATKSTWVVMATAKQEVALADKLFQTLNELTCFFSSIGRYIGDAKLTILSQRRKRIHTFFRDAETNVVVIEILHKINYDWIDKWHWISISFCISCVCRKKSMTQVLLEDVQISLTNFIRTTIYPLDSV